jgi:hypothetical protein
VAKDVFQSINNLLNLPSYVGLQRGFSLEWYFHKLPFETLDYVRSAASRFIQESSVGCTQIKYGKSGLDLAVYEEVGYRRIPYGWTEGGHPSIYLYSLDGPSSIDFRFTCDIFRDIWNYLAGRSVRTYEGKNPFRWIGKNASLPSEASVVLRRLR